MTSARTPQPDFERELRDMNCPTPPADLAAQIKLQIPSSEELVAAAGSETKARRATPWFRLAATVAIAGLAGTVAWQTMKVREVDSTGTPAALASRALDDVDRRATPSAPAAAPSALAKRAPEPEEKLLVREEGRSDLAATEAPSSPSPSLSRREVDNAAPAKPVAPKPAAPAPASGQHEEPRPLSEATQQAKDDADLTHYHRNVLKDHPEFPDRVSATISVVGEAGQVDIRSSATSAPVTRERSAKVNHGDAALDERRPVQPDTMIFRDAGVNRFVITADDRLSTFALDVDTGSYTLARSYLERGLMPPPEAIRLEEFVNAMKYSDPAPSPRGGGDFALFAEGSESPYPDAAGLSLLRFAVKAREVDASDRKPANLTFVVDVSGSMDRENRLGLVKRALGLLLDELTPEDRVGLVVYGTEGRILLHPTYDHGAIREAIGRLVPEGSTNAEAGLRLGYDLADEAWTKGEINRIVLCSDGVANVGATGPESILARIGEQARRGIQLTTVGFGMGNYNDALMERLANQGDGSYHYVDELDEARKVFVENLTGTLQHVAKDAKIQVEFDPRTVERWRLLGYENRDVADRDFRNDAVDAGEVGAGQAATALYEVRLRSGARPGDRIARLKVRWKSVDGTSEGRSGEFEELSRELRVADVGYRLDRASRDLRLAATAAAFAEKLKSTRAGEEMSWPELQRMSAALAGERFRDTDVQSLADLVDRAARLAGQPRRDEPRPGNERLEEE